MLVDSRRAFARCVNHALVEHGLPPRADEDVHPFLGPPLHATFTQLAGSEVADSCVESYRVRYRAQAAAESSVIEGIDDALASLDEELVVVTSKPRALAEPLLDALGLRARFAAVFGPSLSERAEPKAATLARALAAHAPRALVGDRSFDMHAARAHGIRAVGVLWGIGDETELRAAGAHSIAASPAELVPLLA